MNKKKSSVIYIVILVVVSIIMGGLLWLNSNNVQLEEQSITQYDKKESTKEKNVENSVLKDKVNVVSDVMSRIKEGAKMKCTIESIGWLAGNEVDAKVYIDGDTYKTVTEDGVGTYTYTVNTGKIGYIWQDSTKSGVILDADCLRELNDDMDVRIEDLKDEYEGAYRTSIDLVEEYPNIQCELVQNVDVSIPKNINFFDECAFEK